MKIDIVFSFRNEENNIPELVRRTVQVMNSLEDVEYEMIFVNDDSKD
jgi:dolichol-phosphate mannosyltransferase